MEGRECRVMAQMGLICAMECRTAEVICVLSLVVHFFFFPYHPSFQWSTSISYFTFLCERKKKK